MINIEHKIEQFIPFGELIRGFANQPLLTNRELNLMLRQRGIFINNIEKESMIPTLISLLLSPKEFDILRDSFNTREDKPKRLSSTIEWNNPETLLQSLPRDLNLNQLITKNSNVKVLGVPRFVPINNNADNLICEFEIERNDINKCWYEQTNKFKGTIILHKTNVNQISLKITHTAIETKTLAEAISKKVIQSFKDKKCIQLDKELDKIIFNDFSNEDRIVFFNRLSTRCTNHIFEFNDITDIEFKPDDSEELPTDIDWLKKKKEIIMKGTDLHNTFFFKERQYHKCLVTWAYEVKFNYSLVNQTGSCVFYFGFPDFTLKKKGNAEFEMNILRLNPSDHKIENREKSKLESKLLDEMDKLKNEVYMSFKEYLKKKLIN